MNELQKVQIELPRRAGEELYTQTIEQLARVAKAFETVCYGEVGWCLERIRLTVDIIDTLALALSPADECQATAHEKEEEL